MVIPKLSDVGTELTVCSRRALPKSALSRVFFPSQDELLEYFSPSAVPHGVSRMCCQHVTTLLTS